MATTTITALDFSDVLKDADPPELAAFKKKVIEEAKRHSRSFHCGEYKTVLRNLGIKEKDLTAKIEIETKFGLVLQVDIEPQALQGKTVEEQKKVVLDTIGTIGLNAAGKSLGIMRISPDTVTRMEIAAKPVAPEAEPDQTPSGVWAYSSSDGRVKHYYRNIFQTATGWGNISRPGETVRVHAISAQCGASGWGNIARTSTRGEDRHCARCQSSYNRSIRLTDMSPTAIQNLATAREYYS